MIVFGLDERERFTKVGVYDAQDLQKKLMEIGEEMTPVVRPVVSVFDADGMAFVTAEILPVDLTERPCFKTAKGPYIRVRDVDKPMTEYEVYSYEAYRRKYRDDIRLVDGVSLAALDQVRLEQYLLQRRADRPDLNAVSSEPLYELTGIIRNGQITLAAVLLFILYPQAYFPQLSIIATRVPGTELDLVDSQGRRFSDSKRLEGTLPELLDGAVGFVKGNMRTALRIDPATWKRSDDPEYPMDAVWEVLLNALVYRDYSSYTENIPIQIFLFSDRMEVRNPGGFYGCLTVDQRGKMQPDTRNPFMVTAMEAMGQMENRYSGIPRICHAMSEAGLPQPVFQNQRGEFSVTLYNRKNSPAEKLDPAGHTAENQADEKGLLAFCAQPRTRKEIAAFLGIALTQYAIRRYVEPLVQQGALRLAIPEHPRSPRQTYTTAAIHP